MIFFKEDIVEENADRYTPFIISTENASGSGFLSASCIFVKICSLFDNTVFVLQDDQLSLKKLIFVID